MGATLLLLIGGVVHSPLTFFCDSNTGPEEGIQGSGQEVGVMNQDHAMIITHPHYGHLWLPWLFMVGV